MLTIPESVTALTESPFWGLNLASFTISLKTLETAAISESAFDRAFIRDSEITLTGIDGRTVTLHSNGLSVDGKDILFAEGLGNNVPFHITNVENITNSTIINNSGEDVAVDGKTLFDNNALVVGELTNNAYLAELSLDNSKLMPAYSNLTTEYQALVTNEVAIKAVPQSAQASVMINETAANAENDHTVTCPLEVGEDTITVVVTAADGTTTRTYTIQVIRNEVPQDLAISTPDELLAFAADVNSGKYNRAEDVTVVLTQDIEMTGKNWTPIGNNSGYFRGTFDGQGHKITNLTLSSETKYNGLFGLAYACTIKNVSVSGTYARQEKASRTYDGGIAGEA